MQLSLVVALIGLFCSQVLAETLHYDFAIKEASYTRLCRTKKILTVNGKFPGPTIKAHKGDTIIVNVSNKANYNITIHWHGVDQPRNPWSDGPEFVTQCPIKPGSSFTYTVLLSEEEGTLWWHAHSDWSRATIHGAIIIHPKAGTTLPFPKPYKEIPLILGEWWNGDIGEILGDLLRTGGDAIPSDAYTINGQPGDLYPCSKKDTFKIKVAYGKTYLLKLINAAMNNELFFAIAGHKLTVVGTDGSYTKPYSVDHLMITPGQTMDVLLLAKPAATTAARGRYYIAAHSYNSATTVSFDNTTTTGIIEYSLTQTPPAMPALPAFNDTPGAEKFISDLRSLYPGDVPKSVDERMVITIAVNELLCVNSSCAGPNGTRLSASLNNISFVAPPTDILQAYYKKIGGVFGTNFPARPPVDFDFTGDNIPHEYLFPRPGTEVRVLEYGQSVEVVFQGTNLLQAGENHPMHLHGFSFHVVGRGFGNFDEKKDPLGYNLEDPPYENTIGVPKNGWAAIRFRAKNPGVWYMHCHLERHSTWGMDAVFIVKNGAGPNQQMLPPPKKMPRC